MASKRLARITLVAMEARNIHQVAETTPAIAVEQRLRLLHETGLRLSSERSLDVIVQASLDSGLALSAATYGAFSYPKQTDSSPHLFKVAGAEPAFFDRLLLSLPSGEAGPWADANDVVRIDDLLATPYARRGSSDGSAHPPVRSFLAVPVKGRSGNKLGWLLYGHPAPAVFQAEAEISVAAVAFQLGIAIENLELSEQLSREAAVAETARAEQRSTDRRLRQALDAAQMGTWIWDAGSGLIDFDRRAAGLFEVTPHIPLSRDQLWRDKVLEDDRSESPEDLRTLLDAGAKYAAEYRIQLADGSLRWISASGIPTLDESSGTVTGMTGTVQDISLRKNQEESLRQSEKLAATGRLAATIAHEINNPLEAVTNLIYLSKTDPTTPAPVQRLLETADNELARVSQIAQQTLGFYRDTTNPVTIDLNELLGAVVDLFGRKLAVKRLQVTLDLDPGLSIVGLQGEIRQVVSNLLVNAIDASPSNGSSIRIRGRHRHCNGKRGVSVMISDQGSGIPSHVRNRLFTPFVTTKQSRGTGLGLWVTRGMVEKHGGTVRFRSCTDTPAGTVFRVYLPQTVENPAFTSPTATILQ